MKRSIRHITVIPLEAEELKRRIRTLEKLVVKAAHRRRMAMLKYEQGSSKVLQEAEMAEMEH